MPNIWMDVDTALPEVPVNIIALTDDSDFVTREESVTFNQAGMDLVWNFVSTAGIHSQTEVTPTDTAGDYDWVNQGNGMYTIEIPLSGGASINNDAEGFGWFSGFATGILPWSGPVIGFRLETLNNTMVDAANAGATPATQSQLNQVANVSGQAKRASSSYVLTTGTQSANTVAATEELDGTRHEHTDTAGAMDLYYEFEIGAGLATEIKFTGYLQGNNDDLEVYGFDWVSSSWKQIGTLNGQASSVNVVKEYDLLVDMVGSGANEGTVRVRFTDGAFTLTTATFAVDQILVVFSLSDGAYENGAVWLDTNASNTNTVRGVDGRASNPVSTIAAVNTLLASANLNRVEVAPNSSFTLAATQANQQFNGKNWTLALGGQSISGSYIEGADVSGIGTGASEIHFDHCHFGNVTLPPCDCESCVLEGTFTFGTAGNFFFENVKSGVAGISTPIIDFGAALNASNLNLRSASLGIELQNMGAGTGSYNCSLEGFGQLVINANCSATSTIAIRGHFPISGDSTAIAAITFSDEARFEVQQITGGEYPLDTDNNGRIRIVDGTSAGEIDTSSGTVKITDGTITTSSFATGAINAAAIGADAITAAKIADGAFVAANFAANSLDGKGDWNTVVPDVGGTAAGLHSTTDSLITARTLLAAAYFDPTTDEVVTDSASRTASKADVSALALEATVDTVKTDTAAILLDTGTDGVKLTVAERNAVADALLVRNVSNVEGSAGDHSLCYVVLAMSESDTTTNANKLTVFKTDGTTEFVQKTITTDAAADPLTKVE